MNDQEAKARASPSPPGEDGDLHKLTSLKIFRSYFQTRLDGTLDASGMFSTECYQAWVESRKNQALPEPERQFQRAISSHISALDGRVPFTEMEEMAILAEMRKKQVWPCFRADDQKRKIGVRGYGALGFHERRRRQQQQQTPQSQSQPPLPGIATAANAATIIVAKRKKSKPSSDEDDAPASLSPMPPEPPPPPQRPSISVTIPADSWPAWPPALAEPTTLLDGNIAAPPAPPPASSSFNFDLAHPLLSPKYSDSYQQPPHNFWQSPLDVFDAGTRLHLPTPPPPPSTTPRIRQVSAKYDASELAAELASYVEPKFLVQILNSHSSLAHMRAQDRWCVLYESSRELISPIAQGFTPPRNLPELQRWTEDLARETNELVLLCDPTVPDFCRRYLCQDSRSVHVLGEVTNTNSPVFSDDQLLLILLTFGAICSHPGREFTVPIYLQCIGDQDRLFNIRFSFDPATQLIMTKSKEIVQ